MEALKFAKIPELNRMESITCHLKDDIEIIVNGEKRIENIDIAFDFPLPLLAQYREYPVNDFTEFDDLIDEWIAFCHEKGFAEEDMTYLTQIQSVAVIASCCFLPNFRPKERQQRSFTSWACATWVHDDHCDGEDVISLEETFKNRNIFEDMCKRKRPHPTNYKLLDKGRGKCI
ncbi:hypothetical protein CDD81_6028 [Ophiocordyceps australis]|uniref:Uncharacterized protein n=1 Tax=Ophiocordyceps australis TaxID=1399860 RepID=A0A2C5XSR5_9HYPO|nr:hypothetical protein CDD81_6028 [Ophiocordyceps australis]